MYGYKQVESVSQQPPVLRAPVAMVEEGTGTVVGLGDSRPDEAHPCEWEASLLAGKARPRRSAPPLSPRPGHALARRGRHHPAPDPRGQRPRWVLPSLVELDGASARRAIGPGVVVGARHELGLLDVAMLGALSAFLLWIVCSAGWSSDPAQSLLEAQRGLVYVTGVAAFLLLSRRHAVSALACAITAAISLEALYALATRLFPDRLGAYDPIAVLPPGRARSATGTRLGICSPRSAILLSLGLVLHQRRSVRLRPAVALVILLPTLYFTFSRGAWVALGIGAAALCLNARERLRMITAALFVLPAPAAPAVAGSRAESLTHEGSLRATAVESGHRLALVLLLLLGIQISDAGISGSRARAQPGRTLKRLYGAALLATIVVVASFVFVRFGGPPTLVSKGYTAFKAPPPSVGPT